jgi:hypothetical protein
MRFRDLKEAPIADMGYRGDLETAGSFRDEDLKKMRHPVWNERVKKIFSKTEHEIGLYFVNGPAERRVDFNLPGGHKSEIKLDRARDYVGLHAPGWADKVLGGLPEGYQGRLNVILMQNEGTDRVGLTPWIVAHRIGHCFLETNERTENRILIGQGNAASQIMQSLINTMERVFEQAGLIKREPRSFPSATERLNAVAKLISPFRTARTGNIRDTGEYCVELFAQYLVAGRVWFNRFEIDGTVTRRKLEGDELALFKAMRRPIQGYHHPIPDNWLKDEALNMVRAARGLPGAPKTSEKAMKMYKAWNAELQYSGPENQTHKMEIELERAEENINSIFKYMVDHTIGQFVVL